jgi:hypothetical protein
MKPKLFLMIMLPLLGRGLGGGLLFAQTVNQSATVTVNKTYTIPSAAEATAAEGATIEYQWLENGRVVMSGGAEAVAYTNTYGKSTPGKYEYVRQVKAEGCDDWISSNAYVVDVVPPAPSAVPGAATTETYTMGNLVWSAPLKTLPSACSNTVEWVATKEPSAFVGTTYTYVNATCAAIWNPCPAPWRKPTVYDVIHSTQNSRWNYVPTGAHHGAFSTYSPTWGWQGGSCVWVSDTNGHTNLGTAGGYAAPVNHSDDFAVVACVRDL